MVDKALYIGTSSERSAMKSMDLITNNLANSNTDGFRADYETSKPYQVNLKGQQTRAYSVLDIAYSDFTHGPIYNTGRDLDVAISSDGFFAVQSQTGKEAYTRAGNFQLKDGLLKTESGQIVLGTNGVISIPQDAARVSIGDDGSISVQLKGDNQMVPINRLKLTNPLVSQLQKGADGLFYFAGQGGAPKPDENVRLTTHALEGSNVNPVKALTDLIDISRQFQLHTNFIKTMGENANKANQLLEVPKA